MYLFSPQINQSIYLMLIALDIVFSNFKTPTYLLTLVILYILCGCVQGS